MGWGVVGHPMLFRQSLQIGHCQDSALPAPPCEPPYATAFPFCPFSVSELEMALNMDPAAFQAVYCAEKPKPEDKNLIFFCQMGKRGLQATQLAQGLGYTGYDKQKAWPGWVLTGDVCWTGPSFNIAFSPQGSELCWGL